MVFFDVHLRRQDIPAKATSIAGATKLLGVYHDSIALAQQRSVLSQAQGCPGVVNPEKFQTDVAQIQSAALTEKKTSRGKPLTAKQRWDERQKQRERREDGK